MKKILALILILCMVFALSSEAFAAGKPKITKQPETATTSKKGSVTFTIKVKGDVSYSWYLVDPATGEATSAQKLKKNKTIKGLGINGANSSKLSLSKVPESMHGWQVYCHINGNGYKMDSDRVLLLVYGKESPADSSSAPEEPAQVPETAAADQVPESPASTEQVPDSPEQAPDSPEQTPPDTSNTVITGDIDPDAAPPVDRTITVTASDAILRKLDGAGNLIEMDPVSSLEFLNTGSFIVTSDEPVKSWSVNGIRFEPAEPVREFKVMNVKDDITLNVIVSRSSAETMQLDNNRMCKVTCKGCTFTFLGAGIRSATEGEVPAGAPIRVVVSGSAANGYQINGSEPQYQGKTSFSFTVNEDVEIVVP